MNWRKPANRDLSDEQIEAIVAAAIAAESADAQQEAAAPSSAIVWWRAQMRARREAALLADKPIAVVHALSIAAGVGVMLGVLGYAIGALKGSWAWLTTVLPSVSLTNPWVALTLTTTFLCIVIASAAAYVAFSRE